MNLSGAVVDKITTSGSQSVEIKAAEGAATNNVGTVEAATPVTLVVSVDKFEVTSTDANATEITLVSKDVAVSVIDTNKSVTLTGSGSVGAINVTDTTKDLDVAGPSYVF